MENQKPKGGYNPGDILRYIIKESANLEEKEQDNKNADEDQKVDSLADMDPEEAAKWRDVIMGRNSDIVTDEHRLRQTLIPALRAADMGPSGSATLLGLLDEVNLLVEITPNVDIFMHCGGVTALWPCLSHSSAEVRTDAFFVLATCVPNNKKFQNFLQGEERMPALLQFMVDERDENVLYKIMSAIGGFFRNFPPAYRLLLAENGFAKIAAKIQANPTTKTAKKNNARALRMLDDLAELVEVEQLSAAIPIIETFLRDSPTDLRPNDEELPTEPMLEILKIAARRGSKFLLPIYQSRLHAIVDGLPASRNKTSLQHLFLSARDLEEEDPPCRTLQLSPQSKPPPRPITINDDLKLDDEKEPPTTNSGEVLCIKEK